MSKLISAIWHNHKDRDFRLNKFAPTKMMLLMPTFIVESFLYRVQRIIVFFYNLCISYYYFIGHSRRDFLQYYYISFFDIASFEQRAARLLWDV